MPRVVGGCSLTHVSHLTFRFGGIVSLCAPATRKRDCLTALCLCSTKFLLEDGKSPLRPPGSASRPRFLRAVQGCVRFVVPYMFRGEVLLCGHFCRQFLSNTPGRVPRCLEWVRYSLDYLGQGPAGGRRLALRVSPSIRDSTFARCRFSSFVRYGVARCSCGVCVCVGSFCCAFWELRATTNGAVLRESQKLR